LQGSASLKPSLIPGIANQGNKLGFPNREANQKQGATLETSKIT